MSFVKTTAFILFSFILFTHHLSAQQKMTNYAVLWKKIDSLSTKKGLTQSALEEVNKIYVLAKKEKQDAQVIKALLYQASLQQITEEEADNKTIVQWQQEINTAGGPSKSILQSILAEKYLYYFQQHRYQLYDRTKTTNFKKEDIATWGADDFHEKISALYLASLKDEKLLQQTTLDAFEPIIIKGNARYLRPTLYDLLAHRALEYFKDGERDITKAAYAFEINDVKYFSPAADFIKLTIITKDSASLYHKALLIYQKLLAFHLNDQTPDALIDADIQRLQFVQQHSVVEDNDKLYEKALTTITTKYEHFPVAAQAAYLIALLHTKKGSEYSPLKFNDNDSGNPRYEYLVAAEICKKVLQQKDSSEGYVNCYNLLKQFELPALKLTTEKVNVPGQPFRTLVTYRNLNQLYFRVIKLTDDLDQQLTDRYSDRFWRQITNFDPISKWSRAIPATNDYQEHSTEVKVESLPVGRYILLCSAKEDFSTDKNPLSAQFIDISSISYVNNETEFFVLNRETGKPLANASVQKWWSNYDYNSRATKKIKGQSLQTDKNGYVRFNKEDKATNNLQIEIKYENDRLLADDRFYSYHNSYNNEQPSVSVTAQQYEKDNSKVFFFTDRSIYRPGQTVYFKGIAITEDFYSKKSRTYQGVQSKVFLRNANGENVDSLELKTNEYGSYAGKFILPQGALNGEFTLIDENLDGSTYFSVEEYKRPKFYVEYEKVQGTYKVNDSITITGFAKAYAGNNIDGAQVKYRVQRVARFIYPWLYWKRGYPQTESLEITQGVAVTDAEGKFKLSFRAIPDESVKKTLEPIFDYQVTADITDINGETRSGETTIPVSYKALQLKVTLPAALPADSLKKISITTQNLNGEFEPAQVSVYLYGLQAPDRLIRKRYWPQPDQFAMTKEEFIRNFPNDEYQDESDYRSWKKDRMYLNKTDSTSGNGKFDLPVSKLPQGWYAVEVSTKDKYGQEVKDVQYIQLYDEKSKTVPGLLYTWQSQKHEIVEPGGVSTITIGSAANDLFIIQQVEKLTNGGASASGTYSFLTLNSEKQSFKFPVAEADRGGFAIYHLFVKNNRVYYIENNITVPWTNKELQISFETFRDKTLPGSEEKWKLKIIGYKKEKVAAEMLASLYDASLDQFKGHSWNLPDIWEIYSKKTMWMNYSNFTGVRANNNYINIPLKTFAKWYDVLGTQQFGGWKKQRKEFGVYSEALAAAPEQRGEAAAKLSEPLHSAPLQKANSLFEREKQADKLTVDTMVVRDVQLEEIHGPEGSKMKVAASEVQIRKNFNETAFFFPDLKTDSAGNIEFGFTIPEALTKWKFQALAHTKDLAFGYSTNTVVTQKPVMVQPNAPRFLREGDKMELSTKVVNLTDKEITGTVELSLTNTATNVPVDGWFHNMAPTQFYTAAAGQSTVVKFSIDVPYQYNSAVSYRFIAKGGNNTDGEEAALPVLTNSMLVTESMPLPLRGNTAKNFRFEKLLQSGNSETLQQHALTVEFTTNPAWYAVQALPYLMEYPYECAEQTFNRYYANSIAAKIAGASPKLKEIFERWKTSDSAALLSNLQKNPELKSVLLEEIPWVMEAKNETQQKKNIALLFDMLKMSRELASSLEKLKQMQSENGGFVWFKGGPDDRYITQYIMTGLGHLAKLHALTASQQKEWASISTSAIKYLDQRIKDDYDYLVTHKMGLDKNNLGYMQVQYLYMRSFFDYIIPGASSFTAINYYRKQSQQYWLQQNKYMQGMIALSLSRSADFKTAGDILKSLKQNAIVNDEMGMYWKENTAGYYWHQAPVETQSLLIEAFAEIGKDTKTVDDLKTWLLKQKQTQNWKTTKATAEACYALLLQGSDWLNNTPTVEIKLGDKTISSSSSPAGGGREGAFEAGTGYFKQTIEGPFVKPAMGDISVKIASPQNQSGSQPAWGAVYWQYFEHLDKITTSATPLQLNKQLFVEKNTDRGPVLEPVAENAYLKVGDKIKVRIELRVDRDMEYVQMKDMRASCMEPVNVLSGYKWQGGLGYYESTKDASTNFFFGWLPKGTYVFEYPLFVTHTGNFSNGITSIQCMYAPEFSSHSEGVRINAEQ